ncbi:hypothetical protein CR513_19310, partial [Mucuna pruriens]
MYISGGNDRLSCKLFPDTLRGFAANKVKKLEVTDLFDIKQSRGESLKSYLARFNNATIRVDNFNQKFFVKAFQKGLRAGPFSDALALRREASMEEIRVRAEKHVEVEEDQAERLEAERVHGKKDTTRLAQPTREHKQQTHTRARDIKQHFTPLTEKRAQILREICYTSLLEFP